MRLLTIGTRNSRRKSFCVIYHCKCAFGVQGFISIIAICNGRSGLPCCRKAERRECVHRSRKRYVVCDELGHSRLFPVFLPFFIRRKALKKSSRYCIIYVGCGTCGKYKLFLFRKLLFYERIYGRQKRCRAAP